MISFVRSILIKDKKQIGLLLFLAAIYATCLVSTGFFVEKSQVGEFGSLSVSFVFVIVLRFLFDLMSWEYTNRITFALKKTIFEKLENNLSNLRTKFSQAEILERFGTDSLHLVDSLISASVDVITSALTLFIVGIAICLYNPFQFAIASGVGVLFILFAFSLRKVSRKIHYQQQVNEENIFRHEKNFVEGYEYLNSSNRLGNFKQLYINKLSNWLLNERKRMMFDSTTAGFMWAARFAFVLLLITPVMKSSGVSPVIAFWIYILINLFQQMSFALLRILSVRPIYERCEPIFHTEEFQEKRKFHHDLKIEAENLDLFFGNSFKHIGPNMLQFSFQKGDRVWVKGPSGYGKTTLLKVLMGEYPFFKGSLTTPDHKFKYSIINQDPFFFDGESVLFNLGLNSIEELSHEYIKALSLEDFFQSFQYDLNKKLGVEGIWPSRGQRMRLAMLRELHSNSEVLLIDEPTAGLEESLARNVLRFLKQLSRDKIILVCEHNPIVGGEFEPNQIIDLKDHTSVMTTPRNIENELVTN